jgi:preprotein translocase SecE subunit
MATQNVQNPFSTALKRGTIPSVNKVVSFIKESYSELKRTQWPSQKETLRLTGLVIAVSLGVGLSVSLFDYLFKDLLALLIGL